MKLEILKYQFLVQQTEFTDMYMSFFLDSMFCVLVAMVRVMVRCLSMLRIGSNSRGGRMRLGVAICAWKLTCSGFLQIFDGGITCTCSSVERHANGVEKGKLDTSECKEAYDDGNDGFDLPRDG